MIRLDDLAPGGQSWQFDSPTATGIARSLDEVVDVLAAADARALGGEWVVFVLAYEAAAAFDPAMVTAPAPPPGTPFAWWQSFADRRAVGPPPPAPSQIVTRARRPNRFPYPEAVERVRARIALGDVYQVNVTDRFEGNYEGTPYDVYRALVGVQTCRYGAYVEMGERVIASASPEMFFTWNTARDAGVVTCRPMKGTAPRHPRAGLDGEVGAALVESLKDRAENVMIVDLLRNDLARVAERGSLTDPSVTVPELFTLERYETVWQLTSTVQARIPTGTGLVEVLGALFPCGSITGAPKISSMSVIDELEADPRGVYCGAIGVLAPPGAGPRAVCSVPIRTAVLDPGTRTYEYGAGAGITWSSEPAAEDDEVRAKARILHRSFRPLSLLETMRVDAAGIRNVDAHLDRLAASAAWFGFPCDRDDLAARLAEVATAHAGGVARVRLLVAHDGTATVEVVAFVDDPSPVRLAIDGEVTRSDDPFCCHKTTWRRHYDDARARHPGADDVILVNEHGHAIETTIANLAYRLGDRWYCPPLSDGGLAGIARSVALAAGHLTERSIPATDLAGCDELAVLNDLRGWREGFLIHPETW